jgi:hypothetical protein
MSVTLSHRGQYGLWDEIAADLGRVRRIMRQRLRQTLFTAFGAAAVTGALLLAGEPVDASLRGSLATHVYAEEPVWIDIARPFQLYDVSAPDFARQPQTYEARRRRDGGGREDILTLGAFGGPSPYLRLTLHRPGGEPAAASSFFVDLARRGAEAGISLTRSSNPSPLPTRFGPVETAETTLAATQGAQASCLAFRFALGDGVLHASGFACGGDKPIERATLACILDRLDLVASGEDSALRDAFAPSELKRDPACGPKARARAAAMEAPPTPPRKPALRR